MHQQVHIHIIVVVAKHQHIHIIVVAAVNKEVVINGLHVVIVEGVHHIYMLMEHTNVQILQVVHIVENGMKQHIVQGIQEHLHIVQDIQDIQPHIVKRVDFK